MLTSERRRAVTRPDSGRYRPWPFHCGRTPEARDITVAEIAKALGVGRGTIYRALQQAS